MTNCILIFKPSMPLLMSFLLVWISCVHEWTESGFLRRLAMKVIKLTDSHLYSWFSHVWPNDLMCTIFAIIGLNNLLKAYEDKSAFAMCIFSLALGPGEEPITFVGKTAVRCHFFAHKVLSWNLTYLLVKSLCGVAQLHFGSIVYELF